MHTLLKKLAGSDRRSIGRSNQVAEQVLANPGLFPILFFGILDPNPVLRMRCADAVEKITAKRADLLYPYKKQIIRQLSKIDQPEVRWHVCQLFSRLKLTRGERRMAANILTGYLCDRSSIVKTFSMQALADIAVQDAALRPGIAKLLERLTRSGTPAMRTRGRRLVAGLSKTH